MPRRVFPRDQPLLEPELIDTRDKYGCPGKWNDNEAAFCLARGHDLIAESCWKRGEDEMRG